MKLVVRIEWGGATVRVLPKEIAQYQMKMGKEAVYQRKG
jgi:hypothetical protein